MARSQITLVVQSPSNGAAIVGASVTITNHATSAAATIYTSEGGGGTVSGNTITTDSNGRCTQSGSPLWLPVATYDFQISGTGLTTYTVTREVLSANNSDMVALAGEIKMWGGAAAPTGFLLCDGSAVSRTTYSALFTAISTAFGAGDGSTTFNLPNLQQRFPLGKSTAGTGSTLGGTGGAVDHAHSVPALTIPGLSIPGLSIPGLSVPGLSVPGLSVPALSISQHTHALSSNGGAQDAWAFSGGNVLVRQTTGPSWTASSLQAYGLGNSVTASGTYASTALTGTTDTGGPTSTGTGTTGTGTTGTGTTGTGTTGTGTTGTGTTGTGNTGANNPPFQTVNFIIRTGIQ